MEARQQQFVYDNRLSPMARLYLGEIYKYFGTPVEFKNNDLFYATLFNVEPKQVYRWRTELKKYGYIKEEKSILGNKVTMYVPDLSNHRQDGEIAYISYLTPNKKVLRNYLDAFAYFDELISTEGKYLPKSAKTNVRSVCNIFATVMFQENYYNLQMKCGVVTNQEFFQFVITHLTINYVYQMTQRIMRQCAQVQNLNLYVLSSFANEFKGDFDAFKAHETWGEHCRQLREEILRQDKEKKATSKEDEEFESLQRLIKKINKKELK